MPRPRSSRQGGRVTPKGTRPGRRDCDRQARPTPEDILLRDAAQNYRECADLDVAELMASAMIPMFRPLPPDEKPILDAGRVLTAARAHPDRTAAAEVAAALGAYGPPGHRRRARSLRARLVDDGAPVPEWIGSLGDVEPRRAVVMADGWGDERVLWIDFERPDGEIRGIGMRVNAVDAGYACGFLYGPAIAEVSGAIETEPGATVSDIGLADARTMALWGLEQRDMACCGHFHDDESDEELVDDEELRALIDQRVGLLPEGGAQPFDEPLTETEFDDLCDEFLASRWFSAADPDGPPGADEWVDSEETRALAAWLVDSVCRFVDAACDCDPLRWSPARVRLYLEAWIPEKVVCHDSVHSAVEAAFPRWLRFAGERRGLDEDLLEQNLAAARESCSVMRANSADPSNRSELINILTDMVHGVANLEDDDEVEAWFDDYLGDYLDGCLDDHDASAATTAAGASRRLTLASGASAAD